ncbi:MAG TPA: ABC transporter permease [Edaphobacter sp.]|nr:ABC transporter permease [Edaphobacter sp.]
METILQDLRHGLRRLRRAPGFTLTALATLALGIGATTAIFTLTYQVILRSMPVEHPEQLYKVGQEIECCVDGGLQGHWRIFSYDLYRTLRDETPGIDGLAAVQAGSVTVSARRKGDPAAQTLDVRFVSGNYFSVIGVKPLAGRLLTPDDDREGAAPVAVISHAIWQSKFNSDPSLVGSSVMLTGHPVTIVGITAENFLGDRNGPDPASVWLPLTQEPVLNARNLYHTPNAHWLDILARISDPQKVAPAENAMRVELLRWIRAHRDPGSHDSEAEIAKQTTELAPASDGINNLRDDYGKSLTMLQLIAAFVLVIACANLANLMLVRGVARRQELSVRSALGASRSRLVREMLVESVTVAIFGGVLGLFVAYVGVKAILAIVMRGVSINPLSASPSLPVLLFALAVSALTGILFGIAPALMASRLDPAEALRGANRTTGNISKLQRTLVILQAALSVALLSTSGLLILSLQRLQHQDFRFETHGRLIAFIDLQAAGYRYDQLDNLYRQLDQAFASAHNLHDAAWATYSPMSYNNWGSGVAINGGDPNAKMNASYTFVSPRFFDAVGTRVLQGRTFTDEDSSTSRHVAVVNQTFVKKYLDGKQPLGVLFGPDSRISTEFQIIGVVDDSKYGDPSRETRPMFFKPLSQTSDYDHVNAPQTLRDQATKNEQYAHFASNIVVRYDGNAAAATAAVRRVLQQINPDIPIRQLITYDEQVGYYFTRQQLVVRLTVIFGMLALILASIGLYGVTAYGVARRIPEIGLRMALGADRASVVRLILSGAALQIGIGLLLGIPTALVAGHFLQSQLYQVKGYDIRTLLAACAALSVSALIASIVPARRASSVEPMEALRTE